MLSRCGELRCRHFCFRFSYLGHKWLSRNPPGCRLLSPLHVVSQNQPFRVLIFVLPNCLYQQHSENVSFTSVSKSAALAEHSLRKHNSVSLALGPYVKETQQSVHNSIPF